MVLSRFRMRYQSRNRIILGIIPKYHDNIQSGIPLIQVLSVDTRAPIEAIEGDGECTHNNKLVGFVRQCDDPRQSEWTSMSWIQDGPPDFVA